MLDAGAPSQAKRTPDFSRYIPLSGRFPPALNGEQQAELKAAVQELPSQAGIELSSWNWKAVRRYVGERLGLVLSRSSCRNYRHRLGFVLQRPKKQLVKADPVRREAFVGEYAALRVAARRTGTKIFFVDEAHFRADADLRGKWVLKGVPALVDSTSPRRGQKASYYSAVCLETGEVDVRGCRQKSLLQIDEAHFRADADLRGKWVLKGVPALVDSTSPRRGQKASYYSAVCLETGEVDVRELAGNSNATTSTAFLRQLPARHNEPLTVIWDNSPAHRGAALRAYLTTPGLNLYLVNLPSYSPDFNADEAIWGWVRQEVTANLCLGTKAAVLEKVGDFFTALSSRCEEVKRRCRTVLQAKADELIGSTQADFLLPANVDFTLASV